MNNIQILSDQFQFSDLIEKITIPDSFVVSANKIGDGHGEAKLYIGSRPKEIFFGGSQFQANCFLLKKDLLQYLEQTKTEYFFPTQPYRDSNVFQSCWSQRKSKVDRLPSRIPFKIVEKYELQGPRMYVTSDDRNYSLIRELSLPNITYVAIIKLINRVGEVEYYFRLFADFDGQVIHPSLITKEENSLLVNIKDESERTQILNARIGQGKYRRKVLEACPQCPITLIEDPRLLIASHIKPWHKSDAQEKIDPNNGFMFAPSVDKLFDLGFLSFSDEGKTMLSPFVALDTYAKLGVKKDVIIQMPSNREKYLAYHRDQVFKSI